MTNSTEFFDRITDALNFHESTLNPLAVKILGAIFLQIMFRQSLYSTIKTILKIYLKRFVNLSMYNQVIEIVLISSFPGFLIKKTSKFTFSVVVAVFFSIGKGNFSQPLINKIAMEKLLKKISRTMLVYILIQGFDIQYFMKQVLDHQMPIVDDMMSSKYLWIFVKKFLRIPISVLNNQLILWATQCISQLYWKKILKDNVPAVEMSSKSASNTDQSELKNSSFCKTACKVASDKSLKKMFKIGMLYNLFGLLI